MPGKGHLKKERKTIVVKTIIVQIRGKYFLCEIRTDGIQQSKNFLKNVIMKGKNPTTDWIIVG